MRSVLLKKNVLQLLVPIYYDGYRVSNINNKSSRIPYCYTVHDLGGFFTKYNHLVLDLKTR